MVDELSILTLCEEYRLEYPGGVSDVACMWDESVHRLEDGGPTFADLIRLGWLHFDGSRWALERAPIGTLSYINYPSPSTKKFLSTLGSLRLVEKIATPHPEARALAALITEQWLDRCIPVKDPSWLAGRLWERLCPRPQPLTPDSTEGVVHEPTLILSEEDSLSTMLDPEAEAVDAAFLEWSASCKLLGTGGSWSPDWTPKEMRYCREAANRVLDRQCIWGSWDNDAARYKEVLETWSTVHNELCRKGVTLELLWQEY